MLLRVLLGILKGGVVGAALGFGVTQAGFVGDGGGAVAWIVYAIVGFVVGVVCGKPIWRQETLWTPVIKGLVGAALCPGLYWVARKVLGSFVLPVGAALGAPADAPMVDVPLLLAPLLGILYGIFIEVDDGGKAPVGSDRPAEGPKA